jgi:hypothetical protein
MRYPCFSPRVTSIDWHGVFPALQFSVALQNNSQLAGVFATRTAAQDQRNADAINDAMLEADGTTAEVCVHDCSLVISWSESRHMQTKRVQRLEAENTRVWLRC